MLSSQPQCVVVTLAHQRVVGLFAAPERFVTEVLVPRTGVKLSDSKSAVTRTRHRSRQIRPAAGLHLQRLPPDRIWLRIAENPRRRWLTPRSDRVASGNANGTGRVCVGKGDPPSHQTVKVRGINMRVAERRDRIESLLVGHDKQNIGPG